MHERRTAMAALPGTSSRRAAQTVTGDEDERQDSTQQDETLNPNPEGRSRVETCLNLKKEVRLCTWNVQTLNTTGKLTNVIYEMKIH